MATDLLTTKFNVASMQEMHKLAMVLTVYLSWLYDQGRHIPDIEQNLYPVMYVSLDGTIGSGKSSLASMMARMSMGETKYESQPCFVYTQDDLNEIDNLKLAWKNYLSPDWQHRTYDALLEYGVFKKARHEDIVMPPRVRPGIDFIEHLPDEKISLMSLFIFITKPADPDSTARELQIILPHPTAEEEKIHQEMIELAKGFGINAIPLPP
jgi:hypothetical protein